MNSFVEDWLTVLTNEKIKETHITLRHDFFTASIWNSKGKQRERQQTTAVMEKACPILYDSIIKPTYLRAIFSVSFSAKQMPEDTVLETHM